MEFFGKQRSVANLEGITPAQRAFLVAIMEPSQDFKSLQESVQKSLVSTVKTVNRIAAEDLSFQRTVNPEVGQQLEDRTSRLLELATRLLQSSGKACNVKAPKLEDVEDIEMNWRGVVDVVDSTLEKADTALDEYTGLVKRKEPPVSDSVCLYVLSRSILLLIFSGDDVQEIQVDEQGYPERQHLQTSALVRTPARQLSLWSLEAHP